MVEEDEYQDGAGVEDQKVADKFNLSNFIRSVNRKHNNTYKFFSGEHHGVLMHTNKVAVKQHHFYYVTMPGKAVKRPLQGSSFQENQVSCALKRRRRSKRSTARQNSDITTIMPAEPAEVPTVDQNRNVSISSLNHLPGFPKC